MQELQRIVEQFARFNSIAKNSKDVAKVRFKNKQDLLQNAILGLKKIDHPDDISPLVHFLELEKHDNYIVCNNLGSELAKLKLNVRETHLPEEFFGFIEFHSPIVDNRLAVTSCLVRITNGIIQMANYGTERYPTSVTTRTANSLGIKDFYEHENFVITGNGDITKDINEVYLDNDDNSINHQITSYVLNCLLYINTPNSELKPTPIPSVRKKTLKQTKQHQRHIYKLHGMFDTIQVGYSFHGRTSHVDSWGVSGHWRWQPTNSGLKLIWIKEHSRSSHKNVA